MKNILRLSIVERALLRKNTLANQTYNICKQVSSVRGFTLLELLVAASLIGIVSLVSVRLLFSTVISSARQESIQTASGDVQTFLEVLSSTVKESKRINVDSPTQLATEGDVCRVFRLSGDRIEIAEDTSSNCTVSSPTTFSYITDEKTTIENLNIIKNDYEIRVDVSGNVEDAFGKHDFSYSTTIVKRTN